MSQIPTSFGDEQEPDVAVGNNGAHELDPAEIERQTRQLLGLPDDQPLDDEGFSGDASVSPSLTVPSSPSQGDSAEGEGASGTGAVPPPPSEPATPDTTSDATTEPSDLEPRLTAPPGAPDSDDDGERFVIVDSETEGQPGDLTPPATPAPAEDYDYNSYVNTLFADASPEQRHGAFVNMIQTWDDLNRLPQPYQNAINAMLQGTFDPTQFFPSQPPAPAAPPAEVDPWAEQPESPAIVKDPRVDEMAATLEAFQRAEAQRVEREVAQGAAAAYEEFRAAHPELSREQVDAISLGVNRQAQAIYGEYAQGVAAKDAWLHAAENVIWSNPELRRVVAAAELDQKIVPQVQAAAEAKAAQAAKVAGGSTAVRTPAAPTRSPLGTPAASNQPVESLRDGDLTARIAEELKRANQTPI